MSLDMNITNPAITDANLQEARTARLARMAKTGKMVGKSISYADKAGLAKAARGFEAIFVNMMVKQMKKGLKNESKAGMTSFGADTLQSYNDMLLSEQISNQGRGIGIADAIYSQLSGGEKLQYKTQHTGLPDGTNPIGTNPNGNFLEKVNSRLDQFEPIIENASSLFGVDKDLIKSIITVESAGKPDAVSKAGAKGLMQLMDITAKDLGIDNAFSPKENILGGTKYLKNMMDRFGNTDLALAAYNAGPANIVKYGDIPPFPETQAYIKKVNKYLDLFKANSK
jgi:soluble lytic murein transglycosylase-like protein